MALLTLFDDEQNDEGFADRKVLFATFGARQAIARAESRAAARDQQRRSGALTQSPTRSMGDGASQQGGDGDSDAANYFADVPKSLDGQTQQRARTYARSMLSYVALLNRLKQEFRTLGAWTHDDGRVALLSGDDAAIGAAAERITTFYETQLLETSDPGVILRDHLGLDPDNLSLSDAAKSLLFSPRARSMSC